MVGCAGHACEVLPQNQPRPHERREPRVGVAHVNLTARVSTPLACFH